MVGPIEWGSGQVLTRSNRFNNYSVISNRRQIRIGTSSWADFGGQRLADPFGGSKPADDTSLCRRSFGVLI